MVVRKISEMYDMRTALNRMGIIGIHTPTWGQIDRRWHGDFLNHRFYRVLGCSIRMACASSLPPDPMQISITGNAIAPQDMMNPILYRAVTNETWNSIIGRLYASSSITTDTNSVKALADALPELSNDEIENMYYSMLSSNEWRKAMPQSGLSMKNLRPFVYPVYGTFGTGEVSNELSAGANAILGTYPNGSDAAVAAAAGNVNGDRMLRGRARPYPRLACTMGGLAYDEDNYLNNNPQDIARTYVAAIVLPPAKLQVFYFRMIVDWWIEFTNPVSLLEKLVGKAQAEDGTYTYNRMYSFTSAKETGGGDVGSVDSVQAEVDLVMEK